MAYEKHTWETGEVITAEKLNHIEEGIRQPEIIKLGTGSGSGWISDNDYCHYSGSISVSEGQIASLVGSRTILSIEADLRGNIYYLVGGDTGNINPIVHQDMLKNFSGNIGVVSICFVAPNGGADMHEFDVYLICI